MQRLEALHIPAQVLGFGNEMQVVFEDDVPVNDQSRLALEKPP